MVAKSFLNLSAVSELERQIIVNEDKVMKAFNLNFPVKYKGDSAL